MLRCSIKQTSKFIIISNYSSSTTCCLQTLSCLQRAHLILQPTTKIQTYIIRLCNFYETQWFVICTFGNYKLQPTTVCKLLYEKGYRQGKEYWIITPQRCSTVSVQTALDFKESRTNPARDIRSRLNDQWLHDRDETRRALLSIAKAVVFCGKQNIPLRGHRDSGRLTLEGEPDTNEGAFRALLRFKAEDDAELRRHLDKSRANAQYTSPTIQNELIDVIKTKMQQSIVRTIMECDSGPAFTILADETSDVTRREQLSLCVRHVDSHGEVRQHFLGFWDVHEEGISVGLL